MTPLNSRIRKFLALLRWGGIGVLLVTGSKLYFDLQRTTSQQRSSQQEQQIRENYTRRRLIGGTTESLENAADLSRALDQIDEISSAAGIPTRMKRIKHEETTR